MLISVVLIKTRLRIYIQITALLVGTCTIVGFLSNPAKFHKLIILNYAFTALDIYTLFIKEIDTLEILTFKCKTESNTNITSTVIHSVLGKTESFIAYSIGEL